MYGRKSKFEKYTYTAPDGGWGYMVVIAVIINLIIFSIFGNYYGILYKDLFVQLNMSSTEVAVLNGVTAISYAISGFLTSPLLKLISIRKLALIAGTTLSLGQLATVFIQAKALLFICQGIVKGVGTGVLFNLSYTVITEYFDKKRLLAVSIAQTSSALFFLLCPRIIKWSLEMYGVRGTFLFLSALTMNTILGAVLMQPVSRYMGKVHIPETKEIEMKLLLSESEIKTVQSPKVELNNTVNTSETGKNDKYNAKCVDKNGVDRIFGDITDAIITKKFLLSIVPLGLSLAGFADVTFITMLPKALHSMGWNPDEISWAMSLHGFGDLITRLIFILLNKWLNKLGRYELYVGGLVIAFLTRIGMLWSDHPTVMLFFLTIMGVSKCTIVLLVPLVVAESVGPDKFSAAMGIVMLMFGVFNLILTPVIGAVRDLTDSYPTAFYILASFYGVIIMFWSIELLYKKNKHKWIVRKEIATKS